jgi:hypothetical protein
MMPEIKSVIVATAHPIGPNDTGQCAQGWYTLDGDVVTMCGSDGVPLRDSMSGAKIVHRLVDGEHPVVIAKRLTLRIHRSERGDEMAGFNRPIRYPKTGWR